jgi:hypothetical protein
MKKRRKTKPMKKKERSEKSRPRRSVSSRMLLNPLLT